MKSLDLLLQEIRSLRRSGCEIVCGDVRGVLPRYPEGYFQCVVTSPPYYNLRLYDAPQQVWASNSDCSHTWTPFVRKGVSGGRGEASAKRALRKGAENFQIVADTEQAVCSDCGAWRGHLGLEPISDCLAWARGEPPCDLCYVCHLRRVFEYVWPALRDDGVVWLNMGDTYAGSGKGAVWEKDPFTKESVAPKPGDIPRMDLEGLKPKDLMGIPWRVAFALQADGWWLRSACIWHKPNALPSSIKDRPANDYELVFLLTKSGRYFWDHIGVRQPHAEESKRRAMRGNSERSKYAATNPHPPGVHPNTMSQPREHVGYDETEERIAAGETPLHPSGRGLRAVWSINTQPYPGAHFATFAEGLVELCLRSGASTYGACAACGAPWQRVERREARPRPPQPQGHLPPEGQRESGQRGNRAPNVEQFSGELLWDWRAGCQCTAGIAPCIVLDPFCGSGTVGVVARRLGMRFVGIDSSEAYIEMAKRRIVGGI